MPPPLEAFENCLDEHCQERQGRGEPALGQEDGPAGFSAALCFLVVSSTL